jgi:hypothetical protein
LTTLAGTHDYEVQERELSTFVLRNQESSFGFYEGGGAWVDRRMDVPAESLPGISTSLCSIELCLGREGVDSVGLCAEEPSIQLWSDARGMFLGGHQS